MAQRWDPAGELQRVVNSLAFGLRQGGGRRPAGSSRVSSGGQSAASARAEHTHGRRLLVDEESEETYSTASDSASQGAVSPRQQGAASPVPPAPPAAASPPADPTERMLAMMANMMHEDRETRRQEHAEDSKRFLESMDVAVSGAREQMGLHLHQVESTMTQCQDQLSRDLVEGLLATQEGLHAHVDAAQAEQQQQLAAMMARLEALERRDRGGRLALDDSTSHAESGLAEHQAEVVPDGVRDGFGAGGPVGEQRRVERCSGGGVSVQQQQQQRQQSLPAQVQACSPAPS